MLNRIDLLSLYVCFLNEVSWGFTPFSFYKLWVHNESNITWPTLGKPNVQAKEVYFHDWVCWCMVIDFLRVRFAHAFQCRSCFTQKEKNSCAGLFSSFPWIAGHLVTMDLELTAFVAGSLFDGTTIQLPLADEACKTSLWEAIVFAG